MLESEVRMCVSVTMAPLIPVSRPASDARWDSGTTPRATTAMSASSVRPLLRFTLRGPSVTNPVTASDSRSLIPLALRQWCTSAAMSLSSGGRTWSGRWTSVTSTPIPARFSATSRPMYPPPATTALRGLLAVTKSRMANVSSTVRMVITLGSSVPDISGIRGFAPGDRIRTSYGSSYSEPSSSLLTLTVLESLSMDRASLRTLTSMPKRLRNDSGVCKVSLPLSVITPPT